MAFFKTALLLAAAMIIGPASALLHKQQLAHQRVARIATEPEPQPATARSCTDLHWTPFAHESILFERADHQVCGASTFNGACSSEMDFDTAFATCDRMGARLCAPAELANDVARMTGCDLDDKLVWTTPSFDDATQCRVAAGSSRGVVGDGQPTSTDEDCTARHPVRCCAGGASTFESSRVTEEYRRSGPGACRFDSGVRRGDKVRKGGDNVRVSSTSTSSGAQGCALACDNAAGCTSFEHDQSRSTCNLFVFSLGSWTGVHGWDRKGAAANVWCFTKDNTIITTKATKSPKSAKSSTTTTTTTITKLTKSPKSITTTKRPTTAGPTTTTRRATAGPTTTKRPKTAGPTTTTRRARPVPRIKSCNDLGWQPTQIQVPADFTVCGASEINGQCSRRDLTLEQAKGFCAAAGARLCTKVELQRDVARMTGCGLDLQQVWSGDDGPIGGSAKFDIGTLDTTSANGNPARCCATDDAPVQRTLVVKPSTPTARRIVDSFGVFGEFTKMGSPYAGKCRTTDGKSITAKVVPDTSLVQECAKACALMNDANPARPCFGFEFVPSAKECKLLHDEPVSHASKHGSFTDAECYVANVHHQCGISGVGESCHDGDSTTENDVCGADFLCAGTGSGSGSGSGSAAAVTHDDALVSVGTGSEGTVAAGTVIGVVGGVFIVVGAVLMIASRAQKTDMSMANTEAELEMEWEDIATTTMAHAQVPVVTIQRSVDV